MKIVVASDSHSRDVLDRIRAMEPDTDLYVHCGDVEDDPADHPDWLFVKGNCDYYHSIPMPKERVLEAEGNRIFVCHGDQFPFFEKERFMALAAKKERCGVVFYGHTHAATSHFKHGVDFVNPGSCWKSKDGRPASYAVVHIHGKHVRTELKFEPDWRDEHESDSGQ